MANNLTEKYVQFNDLEDMLASMDPANATLLLCAQRARHL